MIRHLDSPPAPVCPCLFDRRPRGILRPILLRKLQDVARVVAGSLLFGPPFTQIAPAQPIPHLVHQHGASQIVVDGRPFLVRGGELENSSASSVAYLDTIWPKVVAMHFNTVLAPVYWRLIEPREGSFDFSTVDGLIKGARAHNVKVVLLWFGSWKNSMSCYVPDWIKEDSTVFRERKAQMAAVSRFSRR